jgi:hypothetical protein
MQPTPSLTILVSPVYMNALLTGELCVSLRALYWPFAYSSVLRGPLSPQVGNHSDPPECLVAWVSDCR